MATIHIKLEHPTDGGTTPCNGTIRFTPIHRYNRGDTVIIPKPFETNLTNGEANVNVIESDHKGCWAITELPGTPQEHTRYVQIPTTSETLEYTDLIDVNPATLLPAAVTAGPLLQIALAADAQAALAYSRTHPETLVLYSEEESINAMAATVSEIAAVRTAAQTQANHATGAARTAVVAAEAATQNLQHIEDTAKQIGVMAGAIIDAAGNNGETSPSTGQTQDTPVQEDPAAGKGEE